jgi:hypothetical protein
MTRLKFVSTLAVSALLAAAGVRVADGCAACARAEGCGSEHAKTDPGTTTRVTVPKRVIYFRPFCRRSRYVTSRSAPCW